MKKLSNLKGAKALSKKEQKTINGGNPKEDPTCVVDDDCGFGDVYCARGKCVGNEPIHFLRS